MVANTSFTSYSIVLYAITLAAIVIVEVER